MKKYMLIFCSMKFSYYLCGVKLITRRPKVRKKVEAEEC